MSDLVKRLRAYEVRDHMREEAADYIEKLEAQLAAADELAEVSGDVRNTNKTRIALSTYREARK